MTSRTKINFWKVPLLGSFVFACWKFDAERKLRWMQHWVSDTGRHIEIGSGPGSVLGVMRRQNYTIDGLDIRDTSFREDLRPIIYDGDRMPFIDRSYDVALLPTTLHHTPDPEKIIKEATRISKRLIIIEDVYDSAFMEWLTKRFDSLMNLEFFGHPHSNRTDKEWQKIFQRLGLSLRYNSVHRVGGIFKQAVYVLEPPLAVEG